MIVRTKPVELLLLLFPEEPPLGVVVVVVVVPVETPITESTFLESSQFESPNSMTNVRIILTLQICA
jgi:hypothetical protein